MTINYAIEKYESLLAHYELMSEHEMDPYTAVSYSAEIRQLIEWLKDYKRLLKEEGKWKDSTDCIDRVQAQTKIVTSASKYTIAREHEGIGRVEWSDQLIKVSDAVDIIKHLPPVTPQSPKIAHWIQKGKYHWECSRCGKTPLRGRLKDGYTLSDWCPECGARMIDCVQSEE